MQSSPHVALLRCWSGLARAVPHLSGLTLWIPVSLGLFHHIHDIASSHLAIIQSARVLAGLAAVVRYLVLLVGGRKQEAADVICASVLLNPLFGMLIVALAPADEVAHLVQFLASDGAWRVFAKAFGGGLIVGCQPISRLRRCGTICAVFALFSLNVSLLLLLPVPDAELHRSALTVMYPICGLGLGCGGLLGGVWARVDCAPAADALERATLEKLASDERRDAAEERGAVLSAEVSRLRRLLDGLYATAAR